MSLPARVVEWNAVRPSACRALAGAILLAGMFAEPSLAATSNTALHATPALPAHRADSGSRSGHRVSPYARAASQHSRAVGQPMPPHSPTMVQSMVRPRKPRPGATAK